MRATADEHADLFWALRGGGGSSAVVTAIEFRLFPYGEVYAGMFLFPSERAGEVLRTWRDWKLTASDDVTTSMRLLHLPPLPELPDPEDPMPSASASTVLGALDDAALDAFAAHIQPGAPLLFAELRDLGGALARVPDGQARSARSTATTPTSPPVS